jgi:uncharacterized protein (DUF1697 family)
MMPIMTRYIAFLRGINVGGHNVKMDQLRTLFTELGLENVRSYINSGNLFFDTDRVDRVELARDIEQHLEQALGYAVPVFLRTVPELEAILDKDAFGGIELTADKRFSVTFTAQQLDTSLPLPQHSTKQDMDLVAMNPHETFIVWRIINGRPPAGKFPATVLPALTTTRFYHTLHKILTAAKSPE